MTDGDIHQGATYRATIPVTDEGSGEPLEVGDGDVMYRLTTRRGGGETLFERSTADGDDVIDVEPDDEIGLIVITIPSEEVVWSGVVFEEVRVSFADSTDVTTQRSVRFAPSSTM